MIRLTPGRKPRSAMWSASSRIVTSIAPRSQWPCWMRSSSRPGQAMTTSRPPASAWTCGFWPTPPKIVVVFMPSARASGSTTAATWLASSRVGTRISERGLAGLAAAVRGGEPGDQREAEGEGLAGAGAAAAEHVPAGQAVGQRGDLDRERRGRCRWRRAPRPAGRGRRGRRRWCRWGARWRRRRSGRRRRGRRRRRDSVRAAACSAAARRPPAAAAAATAAGAAPSLGWSPCRWAELGEVTE